MNAPFDRTRTSGAVVRAHYEAVALKTLLSIWRRKLLILAICLGAGGLALVAGLVLPKTYAAEAMIQIDFAQVNARETGATLNLDPASLVESWARRLRSHDV